MRSLCISPQKAWPKMSMTTRNVSKRSAPVESAIAHIDRLIGTGKLQPGDAVSEPEIGAALGIGRVPVREAIRILAGEDILTLVPNRSAKVRTLDAEEVLERFELLSWLSAAAIQRLVGHDRHTGILHQIDDVARDVAAKGKSGDAAAALRAMNRFNAIIVEHCGSSYLQSVARRTRMNSYTRYVVSVVGETTINRSAPIYPKLVKLIKAGNGTGAARVMLARSRVVAAETLARLSHEQHKDEEASSPPVLMANPAS
jgi:DNA-binding GntR family transcriptional regulator